MVSTGRELLENMEKYRKMNMRYWYGGKGQIASKQLAAYLKKENPNVWTDSYYREALEDVDGETRVCDCSGLVCLVYEIPQIGSYQIEQKFAEWKGEPKRGMIAWRPGHVGLICSLNGGYMAEMRSIKYDYKETRTYKNAKMEKILYSPGIDYDNVQSTGWHSDSSGLWFAYGNKQGEYYIESVKEIEGERYVFDRNGYVYTGFVRLFDGEHSVFYYATREGFLVTDSRGVIPREYIQDDFLTVKTDKVV